ncbi:unnamed protein product, partial [Choristocarpus tenellus]
YDSPWEVYIDLDDDVGFRLCGTWDQKPPPQTVNAVVMDYILRVVMD